MLWNLDTYEAAGETLFEIQFFNSWIARMHKSEL